MNLDDFKRILVAFADDASELELAGGQFAVQIREETILASIEQTAGGLFITESGGERVPAYFWLVNRIARIPQLARRIEDNVAEESPFVTPSGSLLDHLDTVPEEQEETIDSVPAKALQLLSYRPAGTSTVLYLTSDAGEGKTTTINWMARKQARRYGEKQTPWLLLPINLAGRSFLTFDDIVIAELVNRMRFQFFYYDAFLELVKLGVLVPAFDGFEEMFVEGSSEEALSALGNLMSDLDSAGTVLIAARNAYFEYQEFSNQAKLLGTIQDKSVSFARIRINRWDQPRFLRYAHDSGLSQGKALYDSIADRFETDHPLLTRAVLIKRIVESAQLGSVDALIQDLNTEPDDYFYQFVNTLIEREAGQKWIYRSSIPHQPLLTVKEHHSLLAEVAHEMWISSREVLPGEHLHLIVELFVETLQKPSEFLRQIINRIGQHTLLVRVSINGTSYAFDHEDFRKFYLGEALGAILQSGDPRELERFLEKASLPAEACDAALHALRRSGAELGPVLARLQRLVDSSPPVSYVLENAGSLCIRLLASLGEGERVVVTGFSFFPDALKNCQLRGIEFRKCQFQPTSLEGASLQNCRFLGCTVHRLRVSGPLDGDGSVVFEGTQVLGIDSPDQSRSIYDPDEVSSVLKNLGFEIRGYEGPLQEPGATEIEPETLLAERALRAFMRSTQLNEGILRQKFGQDSHRFMDSVLPKMITEGVLREIPYRGGGSQRRYGLCVPASRIEAVIPVRVPELDEFLSTVAGAAGNNDN